MRIRQLQIANFRSVRDLTLELDETTVFIGANNAGKTAILEAVRIALSRRWGQRGTGFTEYDIHCCGETHDPKAAPPVTVRLIFEEDPAEPWDDDMHASLDDLIVLDDGRNRIDLRVTCEWNEEKEGFEPAWEFLDAAGQPLAKKAQRATNLSGFFGYAPLFYLAALRDAAGEFGSRSSLWSRLLKSIRIPADIEEKVQESLDGLDAELLAADPRLADIAGTIGLAAKVAIGQSEGDARLRMLPMNTWDLISRASVVLQNESKRPWLPLDHHGQGLQSLSVIFLFQASVLQQLQEEAPGTEPVFLLEEPEAHLHPQAARTLWERIGKLPGQKVVTTHSPYFVQNVPLRNLRLVRLCEGETKVHFMPKAIVSDLTWNENVGKFASYCAPMLVKDEESGKVAANAWFDQKAADGLAGCFKADDSETVAAKISKMRRAARGLIGAAEEHELSFLGRRIRGEIFFARRWALVEGQSEYVLLHALGRAMNAPLDLHGVAVIDFQNNGDAAIYPALATSFGIPWRMVTDGDAEHLKFRSQLLTRGFVEDDLKGRHFTLPPPHDLEDEILAYGHEVLLRELLADATSSSALKCSHEDFVHRLKNNKVAVMSRLALRIEVDPTLAAKMPKPLIDVIEWVKDGGE